MYGDIMGSYYLNQALEVIYAYKNRHLNNMGVCEPYTVATKDIYDYGCCLTCPLLFEYNSRERGLRRFCMGMKKVLK